MQEQLACQQIQSDEDTVGQACSEAKAAAGAVTTSAHGSTLQRALPFSAWFAYQARLKDIFLITLELVVNNWAYMHGQGYVQGMLRAGRGKPARGDPGRSTCAPTKL